MLVLDARQIERELELLADGVYLRQPAEIIGKYLDILAPPESISTTECAARFRLIPNKEGIGGSLWSATLTPFINGIQDALDDPKVGLVIVPKPGRVGGTVAAENHLFRRLKFGPLTDTLWYGASDSEIDSYCRRHVKKLFELHPDIAAKIGPSRTDDTMAFKVVAGRNLEWLQINARTITGRDAGYIVVDELDSANRKLRKTMVDQVKIRGTTAGASFKGYLCSHMDAGWTDGIAAAWKESSRGIWYMPCPHCAAFSSPCPTAPKKRHWTLHYERLVGVSDDEMLDRVEASAGLLCPCCEKKAAEVHKSDMLARGVWVHEGQTIDAKGRVRGEPANKRVMGFWIHGTMSPWVTWAELARSYVAALAQYERTKNPERLREVTAKRLGEVYEGAGEGGRAIDPVVLREAAEAAASTPAGIAPPWVLFCTGAIDVGGSKFDVLIRGWDLEGRSHIIDRVTLKQRLVDGRWRDLRPAERQDDWLILEEEVLSRLIPIEGEEGLALPIAGMAIDTGDGHVTWKAREFARAMARKGYHWGRAPNVWHRVRLIKGAKSADAPELPNVPREVNKDEAGRPVSPSVKEYDLGVHKLKSLALERLAEREGGPGQMTFAEGLPRSLFDEFAGEALIDGKWERRGPNESLDLCAYDEAVRQMLQPERAGIVWDVAERRPIWARPVRIEEVEDLPERQKAERQATRKQSIFERIDALNNQSEER